MTQARKSKRTLWLWVVLLALALPIAVIAAWVGTEYVLEETAGVAFCSTCHAMGPMVEAYRESEHAGNSQLGIKAECVDCHLPHEGLVKHVFFKARFALRDTWSHLTTNVDKIDWHARRGRRAEFVYDSGCLNCHAELKQSTSPSHPAYFAGGINPFGGGEERFRCVNCHYAVGHKDLPERLEANENSL